MLSIMRKGEGLRSAKRRGVRTGVDRPLVRICGCNGHSCERCALLHDHQQQGLRFVDLAPCPRRNGNQLCTDFGALMNATAPAHDR